MANLARSYVHDGIAPTDDKESLRLAAESLPLSVEFLIDAIKKGYPDDSRAGSMARAGAVNNLTNALVAAFVIGNGHYDSLALRTALKHLKGKVARDAKKPKILQLVQEILNREWKFELSDSIACAKKVAKTSGYDITKRGYSLSNIKRAIAEALKTTPKKKEAHSLRMSLFQK